MKSKYGQNFLTSLSSDFLDHLKNFEGKCVLEIGTGHGELTKILGSLAKKVVSVEIDEKLYEYSKSKFVNMKNVEILNLDFMDLNARMFVDEHFGTESEVLVCANIPYYITSPIIVSLLESERFSNISLMMQKEVADKILTPIGKKNCSALGVLVRYYSVPSLVCNISRNCFVPAPRVDSSVMSFDAVIRSNVINKKVFFTIVHASFGKRRKNILNSISSGTSFRKEYVASILNKLNIDKNMRAENLTFKNFVDISNFISEEISKN